MNSCLSRHSHLSSVDLSRAASKSSRNFKPVKNVTFFVDQRNLRIYYYRHFLVVEGLLEAVNLGISLKGSKEAVEQLAGLDERA